MKLNPIDYTLIGKVDPIQLDLAGNYYKGAQAVGQTITNKRGKLDNQILLGKLDDEETAKRIIRNSVDPTTGEVDYGKAITNLSNAGLTEFAKQAIENKNKLEDQKAEAARREGFKKYQAAEQAGVGTGNVVGKTEDINIPGTPDTVVPDESYTKPAASGPYQEDPNARYMLSPGYKANPGIPDLNIPGNPGVEEKRPLTYEEKVANYQKMVPLDSEAAMTNSLRLSKEKEPTDADKTNAKLDRAYNNVFGKHDLQSGSVGPTDVYQEAVDLWRNGVKNPVTGQYTPAGIPEKQAMQDKLAAEVTAHTEISGSDKAILLKRIKEEFSVPNPFVPQSEQVSTAKTKEENAAVIELAKAKALATANALRKFDEDNADAFNNIDIIKKHTDAGDYSWLATVAPQGGISGFVTNALKSNTLTPAQKELAAASNSLYQQFRHTNAGSAVSAGEAAVVDNVMGKGIIHSMEDFTSAVDIMEKGLRAKRNAIENGIPQAAPKKTPGKVSAPKEGDTKVVGGINLTYKNRKWTDE